MTENGTNKKKSDHTNLKKNLFSKREKRCNSFPIN